MRSEVALLAVTSIALLALGGCGVFKTELDKCHEYREYQTAKPGPRAQIPDDLEKLPQEARLPIPYGEANTEATPKSNPCLIEPPAYRD